jgi:hypothetical protein
LKKRIRKNTYLLFVLHDQDNRHCSPFGPVRDHNFFFTLK